MKKKFLFTGIILLFIFFLFICMESVSIYTTAEEAITLQIQSVIQAVSVIEKVSVKAEEQEPDGENEILEIIDEASEGEELAKGRLPGEMQYDGRRTFDPDDTIYYKTYYDDFTQGLIMDIDYHPKVSMEKELEDYFKGDTENHPLDYLVSMFYDNRTIEADESELWELFVSHGYDICFHHAEFKEYKLRIVEITDRDGLSLYPVRILMQTWDDDFIYLQDITGPIPRKIRELMVVDRDGIWQMIIHSSGFSRDFVAEEELIFWEFTGTYWILIPMELEINTSGALYMGINSSSFNKDELFETFYYRDGIAFRTSMQPVNKWGDKYAIRLGVMEEVEKNKKFVLKGVVESFGETREIEEAWYGTSCIQFTIVDQSDQEVLSQVSYITKADSCISGTWKIEYKWYGGIGWQECDDEEKDVLIQFNRDSMVYDGLEGEGITYSCEFLAIKDKQERFHGEIFESLGFVKDYFLKFYVHYANKEQKVCPFYNFVLISDKEMVIPDGRAMYKAVKIDDDMGSTDDIVLERNALNSICYGLWEVTGEINGRGDLNSGSYIGERIETSEEMGSFICSRVLGSADSNISELIRILGKEDDTFIVCYEFSEDYDWDFMIVKDGMTAIVVKGGNLYWIERRSDPEQDGIYDELGFGGRKYMYT